MLEPTMPLRLQAAMPPPSASHQDAHRIDRQDAALLPPRTTIFLEGFARSQALTMLLGRKTAPERVACAILDLAGQFGRPARQRKRGAVTFHLYPTRGDLADWLGLTIETVSRCFTRLKRAGLIEFQTSDLVTLLEPAQLTQVASGNAPIPLSLI
ncbi:putative transcriptional regulator, Crp/Fnr family [Rhizobium sp. PDO1-076]|uniref:helix-turn-helix domain-containing protein n=1 Tax=Rhizobium sp. PDO1-076 TaxID=1125979 RepID=UPI00024E3C91|nr:helix-turn-helix domain-containing protein [Rhizobium sp. PDO1-076]EHS52012.1 putative transcriptional regulator, Crp/Fnr family [Rhizobium sp. PDO1-076]